MAERRDGSTLIVVGTAVLVAGLIAGATVGGWAAANRSVLASAPGGEQEIVTVALPDYIPGTAAEMPDVRGLSQADAEAVLAEAGLPAAVVTVDRAPAAGPPGVVVSQTPVFGTLNPTVARIVISEPANVPDVVGKDPAAAVSALQALGARVSQVREYVPGAAIGTVFAIDPPVGSALPQQVTISIADSPVSRTFADFTRLQGSASYDTDVVQGGVSYENAVGISTSYYSSATSVSWDLGKRASVVNGALAAEEPMSAGFGAVVVAIADGREVGRYTITGTSPTPVSWDVRGVSTFTIQVTPTGSSSGWVTLLGAEILGSYSSLGGP